MARGVTSSGAVLLYDGDCGFCSRTVQFVLRRDRRATLVFAALSSAAGREIVQRIPAVAGVDSMIWVERDARGAPARAWVRSGAALRVARYLGGSWAVLAWLAGLVPRPVRDATYDWVARHRRRLGGDRSCLVVSPEQKRRFLDAV